MISAESTESRPSRFAVAPRALTRRPRPRRWQLRERRGGPGRAEKYGPNGRWEPVGGANGLKLPRTHTDRARLQRRWDASRQTPPDLRRPLVRAWGQGVAVIRLGA